jgi:hypothetical protein
LLPGIDFVNLAFAEVFAEVAEELFFALWGSMGFQCQFRHLIASGSPEEGSMRAGCYQTGNLATKKKDDLEHAIASVAPATSSKSR